MSTKENQNVDDENLPGKQGGNMTFGTKSKSPASGSSEAPQQSGSETNMYGPDSFRDNNAYYPPSPTSVTKREG